MAFRTALSGLNAASTELNVTAHNVANVNTTGFKCSRAQFADVINAGALDVRRNIVGNGVQSVDRVAAVQPRATCEFTNNNLDLAISGEGFFTAGRRRRHGATRATAPSTSTATATSSMRRTNACRSTWRCPSAASTRAALQ